MPRTAPLLICLALFLGGCGYEQVSMSLDNVRAGIHDLSKSLDNRDDDLAVKVKEGLGGFDTALGKFGDKLNENRDSIMAVAQGAGSIGALVPGPPGTLLQIISGLAVGFLGGEANKRRRVKKALANGTIPPAAGSPTA